MVTGVLFSDLPEQMKQGLRSSPWHPSPDLEGILVRQKVRFGYARVPLRDLIEEVWKRFEDENGPLREQFASFEGYHEWYKEVAEGGEGEAYGWPPKWALRTPDSMYAIILDGPLGGPYESEETTVIKDGWHRFHWYVDRHGPNKKIPVVWVEGRAEF